jgi:hypothetical protein
MIFSGKTTEQEIQQANADEHMREAHRRQEGGQSEMMNAENANTQEQRDQQEETPLCLRCMRPVDPSTYYCPHCGEATGQLTPYIPFVNIAWKTRIWGQMWRQAWSRDVSIPGRLFRLFLVVCYAPILLIGLIFRPWRETEQIEHPHATDEDRSDGPHV